ncbi:MAG: tautomerase family protein [Bacteroidetes bacterium]|nr:tautomerase family protein [Bacteroidota bacterium]
MPHIHIKHFPSISDEQKCSFSVRLSTLISEVFNCSEDVVSIALEEVEPDVWHEKVYQPDIVSKRNLLFKSPCY